jgi:hypothetical protein
VAITDELYAAVTVAACANGCETQRVSTVDLRNLKEFGLEEGTALMRKRSGNDSL